MRRLSREFPFLIPFWGNVFWCLVKRMRLISIIIIFLLGNVDVASQFITRNVPPYFYCHFNSDLFWCAFFDVHHFVIFCYQTPAFTRQIYPYCLKLTKHPTEREREDLWGGEEKETSGLEDQASGQCVPDDLAARTRVRSSLACWSVF